MTGGALLEVTDRIPRDTLCHDTDNGELSKIKSIMKEVLSEMSNKMSSDDWKRQTPLTDVQNSKEDWA